jgi:nucleoside-diphosphate-sugar epimerase
MNVFITGAAGYIGGSVAQQLLAEGHAVRGLLRDRARADALAASGIQPVLGDLDDSALLAHEAAQADAVINAASSDHRPSIDALLHALRGSGKVFVHTSGTSVIGDDAQGDRLSDRVFDETTPLIVEPSKRARQALDNAVLQAAQAGVRAVVLCNSMIYGTGRGLHPHSVQLPTLLQQARRSGVVRVVGSGVNRWSNAHIDDVSALYGLALREPGAGGFYFVENGEASFAEIGAAIARRLGLGPVQPWTIEEATQAWGERHARYSLGSNSRVRALRAHNELGWAPQHASVTDWIERDMPLD